MIKTHFSSLDAAYEREALLQGHIFQPCFEENKDWLAKEALTRTNIKVPFTPVDPPKDGWGQPPPRPSGSPAVWDLVMQDFRSRDASGFLKYGTRLQANNGRDALKDAYEEALDLTVYLRQALYERDKK